MVPTNRASRGKEYHKLRKCEAKKSKISVEKYIVQSERYNIA